MKVLNYTTSYLAVMLLLIIPIWAAIFYYAMLDEIYDSIDDGLDNQKGLILQRVAVDTSILRKADFGEGDYSIRPIDARDARGFKDVYVDTLMYMQNEQDYEPVRLLRTAFYHGGSYYGMQVITSMVEEDDLLSELTYALIWLYAGLILSILILNNFLLKRIWRPFYHLLKQLKDFRLERPSIDVRTTNIEEFGLLNDAVQKMVRSNVDSYNSQKHFIENASHELQTPLAISINKLEALAEKAVLSEENAALLASALDNLGRLTRLNRSLLLLSRIENRQFISKEEIVLNDLVQKIANDFSDQLSYSHLELWVQDEGVCTIRMNADLALILFNNLVKNAIVHNHPGGSVRIIIKPGLFSIANTGGQEPLNKQTLFSRFNKQVQSQASTGLGLSIVSAIAGLFGYTVDYSFDGMHQFTVKFE